MRTATQRVVAVFRAAELFMPGEVYFRYPLLIVIAVMLLYGIWPGFSPGHSPKTIVCPARAFQPLQQIVPDHLTRLIRLVASCVPTEMFCIMGLNGAGNLPRRIVAKALLILCPLVLTRGAVQNSLLQDLIQTIPVITTLKNSARTIFKATAPHHNTTHRIVTGLLIQRPLSPSHFPMQLITLIAGNLNLFTAQLKVHLQQMPGPVAKAV